MFLEALQTIYIAMLLSAPWRNHSDEDVCAAKTKKSVPKLPRFSPDYHNFKKRWIWDKDRQSFIERV